MVKNMGVADRTVRTLIALVVGWLYFSGRIGGTVGVVLLLVAVLMLATSAAGFCPAYLPFKLSTRRARPVQGGPGAVA